MEGLMEVSEIKKILKERGYRTKVLEKDNNQTEICILGMSNIPIEVYSDGKEITKIIGIYPDHDGPDGNRKVEFGTDINKIPPNFCPPPAYIENSEAL
jgi:hypothetical protein